MLGNGGFGNPHLLGRIGETALVHHIGKGFHFGQSVHSRTLVMLPVCLSIAAEIGQQSGKDAIIPGFPQDRPRSGNGETIPGGALLNLCLQGLMRRISRPAAAAGAAAGHGDVLDA
jgi:hypothetical protein